MSKAYGDVTALDGVSFDVAPGAISGFVGPNGAGKTTAMRIVLGVLAADSGTVRWRGEPLDEESRRRIGYMPEERGLYPKMAVGRQLVYFAQKGKKVTCTVKRAKRKAAPARLVRNGSVYATGMTGKLVARRELRPGAYTLVIGHGDHARRIDARIS